MLALLNRRPRPTESPRQHQHHRQPSLRQRSPRPRGGSVRHRKNARPVSNSHHEQAQYQQHLQPHDQRYQAQPTPRDHVQCEYVKRYYRDQSPHRRSGSYSDYEDRKYEKEENQCWKKYSYTDPRPASTNGHYAADGGSNEMNTPVRKVSNNYKYPNNY